MRVITGLAKGRKLKTPKDYAVRPTTDNVKESVFNIIQNDIAGRKALDLFAGTGQLGIEAISRGASFCTFVDNSKNSLSIIRENINICSFGDKSEVIAADSVDFLKRCNKYDLIFIDPPYDSDLYGKVLENIKLFDILTEGGIIILEQRREFDTVQMPYPYVVLKEYLYGKIKIITYTRESN